MAHRPKDNASSFPPAQGGVSEDSVIAGPVRGVMSMDHRESGRATSKADSETSKQEQYTAHYSQPHSHLMQQQEKQQGQQSVEQQQRPWDLNLSRSLRQMFLSDKASGMSQRSSADAPGTRSNSLDAPGAKKQTTAAHEASGDADYERAKSPSSLSGNTTLRDAVDDISSPSGSGTRRLRRWSTFSSRMRGSWDGIEDYERERSSFSSRRTGSGKDPKLGRTRRSSTSRFQSLRRMAGMSQPRSTVVTNGKHFVFESGLDLDPLLLLSKMPAELSGEVLLRRTTPVSSSWVPYWAELRGHMLILFHSSKVSDSLASGSHRAVPSSASSLELPIVGICSLIGTHISTKLERTSLSSRSLPRERFIRISRPHFGSSMVSLGAGSASHIDLRCRERQFTDEWEFAIAEKASMRLVNVNTFQVVSAVASGASGKVFIVRDRMTGEYLAMKVMSKDRIFNSKGEYRAYCDERLLLQLCRDCPFVIKLRYAFQTERKIYLVTEFCEGGDLHFFLRSKSIDKATLSEPQVRRLAAEIIEALAYVHGKGAVYRDLKLENVLLDANGHVQLADFGLAKLLDENAGQGRTRSICGTLEYCAPEMLALQSEDGVDTGAQPYGISVDFWSLGVLLYRLVRGTLPYDGSTTREMQSAILETPLKFSKKMSPELINLIQQLLDRNPATRLGCGRGRSHASAAESATSAMALSRMSDLREHPFFASCDWVGVRAKEDHPEGVSVFHDQEHSKRLRPRLRRESREQRVSREYIELQNELPNFALSEAAHLKLEPDHENVEYSDTSIWPFIFADKDTIRDYMVLGNYFCAARVVTTCLL
ncbi:Serine/threonine-protein kinase AtPK2/AtPK19 [Porphyridium purpureum]|uniref:Serine/threonine-protein kinase AtPK2/AtPK19 n=1 Tax=Porphyridium purpureum TaxID=35688 RepID=A0A5J4Z3B4_PORPP|nr:Serine/threonine-protein kinase AtPK2/AtPK19 [Porphyridium purpureum]|eukprot:POR8124..scf295_1